MVETNIRIALGERPDLKVKFSKGAAIRFLHAPSGILKSAKGVEAVKRISGIVEVGFFKKIGDEVSELRNSLDRVGYVIAQRDTREEAVQLCEKCAGMIQFEME